MPAIKRLLLCVHLIQWQTEQMLFTAVSNRSGFTYKLWNLNFAFFLSPLFHKIMLFVIISSGQGETKKLWLSSNILRRFLHSQHVKEQGVPFLKHFFSDKCPITLISCSVPKPQVSHSKLKSALFPSPCLPLKCLGKQAGAVSNSVSGRILEHQGICCSRHKFSSRLRRSDLRVERQRVNVAKA